MQEWKLSPGSEETARETKSSSRWLGSLTTQEAIFVGAAIFVAGAALGSGLVALAILVHHKRKERRLLSRKYTSLEMTQRGEEMWREDEHVADDEEDQL